MEKLTKQNCPFCNTKNMTLSEEEKDFPVYGKVFLFSMDCSNCNYHKSDVEFSEVHTPCKITITTNSEKDMKIKIIKSSNAKVKIPQFKLSMESGVDGDGFICGLEELLDKFKKIIEAERDTENDDDPAKKNAKNLLKKIWKAKLGDIPLKIIIEDPSGNSAVISDKAIIEKLKA